MGFKHKLIASIVSVLFLLIVIVIIYNMKFHTEDYSDKLISVMNAKEDVKVQDVFSFEFERAYVFDDCYAYKNIDEEVEKMRSR